MTSPGFDSAETFPSRLTFGQFLRGLMPMLVSSAIVTAALLTLLLAMLFGSIGVSRLIGLLVALILATVQVLVMVLGKKRQFDQTWGTSKLELSPKGVAVISKHARVYLSWEQIHHLGAADLVTVRHTAINRNGMSAQNRLAAATASGLAALVTSTAKHGSGQAALVGAGTTTIDMGTPSFISAQIRQNNGSRDTDPRTGKRLTAIVLPVYDEHWISGRIGAWIKAYRPDLLTGRA